MIPIATIHRSIDFDIGNRNSLKNVDKNNNIFAFLIGFLVSFNSIIMQNIFL